MTLTIHVAWENGEYIATAEELPTLSYRGAVEAEVRGRMEALAKALASPHIRVLRVEPNGEVILTISRRFDMPDDEYVYPLRRRPIGLQEAIELMS